MQTLNLTKKYEVYPEYKDSGVEWLGMIPKEWRVGKVKEVFKLLKERSFNNSESEILSLTLNGIKTRDVSNNEGQIAASYEGYRKIIKGDIVLNPMDLVRGFVDSSKYEGIISPAYATLRKKDKEINSQYYNYFFQKHYFEGIFHPFGNGVSVDHRWTLKDDTLVNFPVLTIPFEQQTKIAKFLDQKTILIDKIIEKKKKQIELIKGERRVIINNAITKGLGKSVEMFDSGVEWIGKIPKGWSIEKLKNRTTFLNGYSFDSGEYVNDGLPIIRISDVGQEVDFTKVKRVPYILRAKINRFLVKKNDLLIALTGGTIGKTSIYDKLDEVYLNQRVGIIRPNNELDLTFLKFQIASNVFKKNIDLLCIGGAQPNIGKNEIGNILFPFPSKDEQKEISRYLEVKNRVCDEAISKIESTIEKLNEYKISLISDVITGKVKV